MHSRGNQTLKQGGNKVKIFFLLRLRSISKLFYRDPYTPQQRALIDEAIAEVQFFLKEMKFVKESMQKLH